MLWIFFSLDLPLSSMDRVTISVVAKKTYQQMSKTSQCWVLRRPTSIGSHAGQTSCTQPWGGKGELDTTKIPPGTKKNSGQCMQNHTQSAENPERFRVGDSHHSAWRRPEEQYDCLWPGISDTHKLRYRESLEGPLLLPVSRPLLRSSRTYRVCTTTATSV